MLEYVLARAPKLEAVTLEVQEPAHSTRSRAVDDSWPAMIEHDLRRAKQIWDAARLGT